VKGLDRRLVRVETVSHRRRQAVSFLRYDVSDLTPHEQYELALLLDRVGLFPHEARAEVPLTPDEQERLEVLVARMRVVEPGSR
jgi:hypothetical protein